MVYPSSDRISRAPPYSILHNSLTITGLSPSLVILPRMFFLLLMPFLADPISLATTLGVSVDFLSLSYLDVSVRSVRPLSTIYSCQGILIQDGFPHSDIHGSMPIHSSPQLFAVYHVLLRL